MRIESFPRADPPPDEQLRQPFTAAALASARSKCRKRETYLRSTAADPAPLTRAVTKSILARRAVGSLRTSICIWKCMPRCVCVCV